MTFEQIKELVELVADRGLEGMEIERSGFKVRIDGRRNQSGTSGASAAVSIGPADRPLLMPAAATLGPESPEVTEPAPTASAESSDVVTSPIVGTFYSAPNPDSPAFVRVGDRVEVGQVLCIVEAMKLMNEIESDVAGIVVEIIPKNAQPVEFGEPLFAIQAD